MENMYIDVSLERVDSILILLKQNKINSIYCTLHNVFKKEVVFCTVNLSTERPRMARLAS